MPKVQTVRVSGKPKSQGTTLLSENWFDNHPAVKGERDRQLAALKTNLGVPGWGEIYIAKDPTNDDRPGYQVGDRWYNPAAAVRKLPDRDVLPIEPRRHGNGDVTLYLRVLASHGRTELKQGAMPPPAVVVSPPVQVPGPPPLVPAAVEVKLTNFDTRLTALEATVGGLGPGIQKAIKDGFDGVLSQRFGNPAPAPPVFATPAGPLDAQSVFDSLRASRRAVDRLGTFDSTPGPAPAPRSQVPRIVVRNEGRTLSPARE